MGEKLRLPHTWVEKIETGERRWAYSSRFSCALPGWPHRISQTV